MIAASAKRLSRRMSARRPSSTSSIADAFRDDDHEDANNEVWSDVIDSFNKSKKCYSKGFIYLFIL
jgi:hypothetical protein